MIVCLIATRTSMQQGPGMGGKGATSAGAAACAEICDGAMQRRNYTKRNSGQTKTAINYLSVITSGFYMERFNDNSV
jgi:hypothetical protein